MVVRAAELGKSYGSITALDAVSFEVEKGELFGFIGPDGAGKTTLFQILATLRIPDAGRAEVLGLDVVSNFKEIRPRLGYMPGRFSLYMDLTVEENITFFATVFGTTLKENYSLVEPIYQQLEPFKNRLAGNLSGGMKQKLALCCALIHKPELLLLDEPTTGVDAVSRKEFWEMLHFLKEDGISIIVSTPYMDEARQCGRVALLQQGRMLQTGSPAEITANFDKALFGIKSANMYALLQAMKAYEFTYSVHPFGESLHYTDRREKLNIEHLEAYLAGNNITDARIVPLQPGIEDSFMALMKEEAGHG